MSEDIISPSSPLPERYYTKSPGASYFLPADDAEKQRLQIQHGYLTKLFRGKLILAPVKFEAGDKILESGVGGGDWILDVIQSKILPQGVSIQGIDIESRNFPDPKALPRNVVTLSINSILSLPPEWSEQFTYVHQRFLVTALKKHQWPIALSQIYEALKPGKGWVELQEPVARHEGPEENERLLAHQLKYQVYPKKDTDNEIGGKLPEMLKRLGFVDVKYEKKMYPVGKWAGEDSWVAAQGNIELYKAFKKSAVDKGLATSEEFDRAVGELWEWWKTEKDMYMGLHVVVARKPGLGGTTGL